MIETVLSGLIFLDGFHFCVIILKDNNDNTFKKGHSSCMGEGCARLRKCLSVCVCVTGVVDNYTCIVYHFY